ncbi:protein LYK5-like [Curcuma longa]|uniref:protein LYK5-like n=1 Tax=Curcuma longa TaxID=136217 RepID=UPI003D9E8ABE
MSSSSFLLFFFFFFFFLHVCHGQQQPYTGIQQLDCSGPSDSSVLGYSCSDGPRSCASYLTFRSTPPYQSPLQIAHLLAADADAIADANGIESVDYPVLPGQLLLVPTTCSCAGGRYQHNASYLVRRGDYYFKVANDTYQGLSTCQAVMAQNPYEARRIPVGARLEVPLRCACPTADQVAGGIKYLLTYLVGWGDSLRSIAERFPTDYLFVLMYPNSLTANSTLFPFSTLLVPLAAEPAARVPTTSLLAEKSGRIGDRDLRIKFFYRSKKLKYWLRRGRKF